MNLKIKIQTLAQEYLDEIIQIRRHLHQYPELSFQEFETSAFIKSVLTRWNIPFIGDIATTGIVVLLEGKNPNKYCVGLRADMDALPIQEANNAEYCSKHKGVMHACGHDVHTASLLGVVKLLNQIKTEWEGTVKFIFQPAEERLPGGAQQMIKEGVLFNPVVHSMFGQHVFPDLEVGKVGFRPGMYMASTDELHINIHGKGGHAALPENTKNPVQVACQLVHEWYSYFEQDKKTPHVFSIGYIQGSGSTNVIPDSVHMMGTLRALNENWRLHAHKQLSVISNRISKEFEVKIELEIRKGYPFLQNDEQLTEKAIALATAYLGKENVVNLPVRMTAEDFAYFAQEVPACFYRLGTANKAKGITHGLHTSRFDVDEKSLEIGVGLMAWLAINGG